MKGSWLVRLLTGQQSTVGITTRLRHSLEYYEITRGLSHALPALSASIVRRYTE